MGFDWNSFTANFLNTVSTGINDRLEKQADERKLLDAEYEDARAVFKNRKKLVSGNMMLVGKARNLGANDMQIKAAISSGEAGLATLVKAMEKHNMKTGRNALTFPEVETLVEGAELFEEGDVAEFLRRSYGLESDEDAPALVDTRGTLGKLFASGDARTAAKLNFGGDRVNMIELARQDAYDSLAPDRGSVYLTTDQARVFDVQQGMRDFYREFNTLMDNIEDTNAYKKAITKPPIKLPDGSEISATQAIVDNAKAFLLERYVKLGGQSFIDNLNPALVDIDPSLLELVTDGLGVEGNNNTSKALIKATAADMGTLIEEVKGNITLKYNVDADGAMLGNITFITPNAEGGLLEREIDPNNKEQIKELTQMGFNFDTMYEDDGTIEAAIKAIPQASILFPGQEITTEVLPPAELGGQMTPLADERRDDDPEIVIPEVDPKDTPSLFDDIGQFFSDGGLSGRAEKRRKEKTEAGETDEEKETSVEKAPTDVTVYGITSFAQQNFSITPDGKVYINDRRTNKPKALVTDQAVINGVLEKNKEFVTNAIVTFIKDANDKGLLSDQDKLMAYWKRFSAKNRLTPYVMEQVEKELRKQLDL
jgi:hypothetical protein